MMPSDASPVWLSVVLPVKVPYWDWNTGIFKKIIAAILDACASWTLSNIRLAQDPPFDSNNREMLDGSKENTIDMLCGVNLTAPE